MFRMNGYVQDERYIAKEHMDVRRDCVNYAWHVNGDVRRDRLNYAWHVKGDVRIAKNAKVRFTRWFSKDQKTRQKVIGVSDIIPTSNDKRLKNHP